MLARIVETAAAEPESWDGKAVLWDTVRKAESVELGIAAASDVGAEETETDSVRIWVCLRPGAAGGLWNPNNPESLVKAIWSKLDAFPAAPGRSERALTPDGDLDETATELLQKDTETLAEMAGKQDGRIDKDGLVQFLVPIDLRELAGSDEDKVNWNLIPMSAAVEQVVGSGARERTPALQAAWQAFWVSSEVQLAVAAPALQPAHSPVTAYVQFIMHPTTVPCWNKEQPQELEKPVLEAIKIANSEGAVASSAELNSAARGVLESNATVAAGTVRLETEVPLEPYALDLTPLQLLEQQALDALMLPPETGSVEVGIAAAEEVDAEGGNVNVRIVLLWRTVQGSSD